MLIYANKRKNDAAHLIFFSQKEAQIPFWQLHYQPEILRFLNARAEKLNVWYHGTHLMQLSANRKSHNVSLTFKYVLKSVLLLFNR